MKSGIYKIVNNINSKCYIGSSIDIEKRIKNHFRFLKNSNHHNQHLQAAFNKYGEENFTYSIIEFCEKDILFERELHHMLIYKSLESKYGYNIAIPKVNDVYSQFNANSIYGICIESNKILKDFNSINEAARFYGIHKSGIQEVLNNENRSYLNMRLISKNKYDKYKDYTIIDKKKSCVKRGNGGYKVRILDLNDNLILELPNSKEVAKYFNTSIKYIGKVTRGEKKTIQGHKLIMIK